MIEIEITTGSSCYSFGVRLTGMYTFLCRDEWKEESLTARFVYNVTYRNPVSIIPSFTLTAAIT